MIVTTSHISQEVAQVMCYGDGYSLTPAAAVEVPSAIQVYTCPTVMIPDPVTESVDRTIHVQTTGNDTTGDGTSVGTAFATLGAALADIDPNLVLGVTITIQFGAGEFDFTTNDKLAIQALNFYNLSTLAIKGVDLSSCIDESGFSTVEGENGTYIITKVGRTFTKDEFEGSFAVSGTTYVPILCNRAGVDSCEIHIMLEGKSYTAISTLTTIFNNVDGDSYLFQFTPIYDTGRILIHNCRINVGSVSFQADPSTVNIEYKHVHFHTTCTISSFSFAGRRNSEDVATKPVELIAVVFTSHSQGANSKVFLMASYSYNQYLFTNKVAVIFSGLSVSGVLSQNTFSARIRRFGIYGSGTGGVGFNFYYGGNFDVEDFVKIIDVYSAINTWPGTTIKSSDQGELQLYKYDVPSMRVFQHIIEGANYDSNLNISFHAGFYRNTTDITFYSQGGVKFIVPQNRFFVCLPGTYPEIETNKSYGSIPVNTTTARQVGTTEYNKSIRLEYMMTRGTIKRQGVADILVVNTTTVLFNDNVVHESSDIGVILGSSIVGSDINLDFQVDNASANTVTFEYIAHRILT